MTFDIAQKRHIRESGLEARIAAIVEPVANALGFSLVRVKLLQDAGLTLQVMAEDANGRFTLNDCEALSRDLSPVLDVEEPIERAYNLEVSSPGIDRPLVRARDFARFVGHEAKIEMADLVGGRKRFRGIIEAAGDETFSIRLPDAPAGTDPVHVLAYAGLAEAKLVMTDALLEAARIEQENNPLSDPEDPEVETVEDMLDSDAEDTSDPSEEIE